MDTQFATELEDGSPAEIGEIICTMWRQCGEGNFNQVTDTLSREFQRHDVLSRSQGLCGGDVMEDSDSEGEECSQGVEIDAIASATLASTSSMFVEETPIANVFGFTAEPPVDADGWETVAARRGRRGGSNK